jgi:hypothetical protein
LFYVFDFVLCGLVFDSQEIRFCDGKSTIAFGFSAAIAGNLMFSVFNRVELICGALALTGVLALSNGTHEFDRRGNLAFLLSLGLFAIACG